MWITLKPILFFCVCFIPHPHSPHHRLVSTQPVKVKRKKSFNLSRKFPFYKSKENIVQELVETEREYERVTRALTLSFMLHPVTVTHPGDGFWLALDLSGRKPSQLEASLAFVLLWGGPQHFSQVWSYTNTQMLCSNIHQCQRCLELLPLWFLLVMNQWEAPVLKLQTDNPDLSSHSKVMLVFLHPSRVQHISSPSLSLTSFFFLSALSLCSCFHLSGRSGLPRVKRWLLWIKEFE